MVDAPPKATPARLVLVPTLQTPISTRSPAAAVNQQAAVAVAEATLPTLAFSFLTQILTSSPHLCASTARQHQSSPQLQNLLFLLIVILAHPSLVCQEQPTHPTLLPAPLNSSTTLLTLESHAISSIHPFAKSAATQLLVPLLPVNKMSPMPTSKESRPTRVQVCLTSTYRHWHHIWYNKTNLPQGRQTWPLECWKAFS